MALTNKGRFSTPLGYNVFKVAKVIGNCGINLIPENHFRSSPCSTHGGSRQSGNPPYTAPMMIIVVVDIHAVRLHV